MTGHLPGAAASSGARNNGVDDIELDIVESHAETSLGHGRRTSQARFPSLRGSLREPVDSENENDGDDQEPLAEPRRPSPSASPNHGAQTATYSEIPHLDPEDGEASNTMQGRPRAVYYFKRYIPRALLNVLAPLLILGFYVFIVAQYFQRPAEHGVIPSRPLDANTVFFAWLILSIFVLDWAKSGIAGFEAAALMTPRLAPSDARQLMWHADRAWGSVSGWCKVAVVGVEYAYKKLTMRRNGAKVEWAGPGPLWFYLAFSSILFYVTVPLSGLSMEPQDALRLGTRAVVLTGTNQTTFDGRSSNDLAEQMDARWRQGNPTTPHGPAVFYAPEGTPDTSDTYFEDTVESIYYKQKTNSSADESKVTFFAGPEVTERTHGTAWGFLTELSCTPVHPYKDLELLQINEINNWTAKPGYMSSRIYGTNTSEFLLAQMYAGEEAVWFDMSPVAGLKYQYVMAANADISAPTSVYTNGTAMPVDGTVEIAMWQSYDPDVTYDDATPAGFGPDDTFRNMSSSPIVVSSVSIYDNKTYLGYGVRCKSSTMTGRAELSAMTNTFSAFEQEPADAGKGHLLYSSALSPGVVGLHTLVYSAFTTKSLFLLGPQKCRTEASASCNGWMGANKATRAVQIPGSDNRDIRYPTLDPARMALALSKLFGEGAVAMMAVGLGNWTSPSESDLGLFTLEKANDIVPGRVPYGVVIALLAIWAAVTVLPQLWPAFLYGRRWGEGLDGFAMFRLGAEWKGAVGELQSDEFWSSGAASLRKVPGMIGDMRPRGGDGKLQDGVDGAGPGKIGFVGLSHHKAETETRRLYTYSSL